MWIKASGTWLAEAATRDIFVPLDHQRLVAALERDDPDCATCMAYVRTDLNALGLRPSIETSVHALMPQPVVFHVHCVETIAWAIRDGAERLLAAPLAAFNWAFVPYARPGLPLAAAIRARLRPGTDVLVLGNHGLVVAADTVTALTGVYHADGTVIGELRYWIGARLGRAHCALCDITHGSVREKASWRAARAELAVPFRAVHLDERSAGERAASEGHTPCVLAHTEAGIELLLGRGELEACAGDPARLVAELRRALEGRTR